MTPLPVWPEVHRDAVVYLAQAGSTGPPWLAIVLAAISVLGVIGAAAGPALAEKVKRGPGPPAVTPAAPTPPTPPAVEGSVDLVREAIDDLRRERDEFQDEARRLSNDLADERARSAAKDVVIAQQELRIQHLLDRLDRGGR